LYVELLGPREAGFATVARDASVARLGAATRLAFRRHGADANAFAMGTGTLARTTEPSDVALVRAIAAEQDKEAFALLFSRFAPRIKAHYARSLKSAAQSDDLVQDVMLSVWRNAESYRPELASVSTWIFRIARNRFVDVVRKQRFVDMDGEEADAALAASEPGPAVDAAFEVQELSQRVKAALGEMPEEQAEVVRGSYFAHESASEMAARLRIPIGTVKSRMRAAMAFLHKRVFEGGQP
jgi:RNA polymerase sigma-70 factor (ECF subfamily)